MVIGSGLLANALNEFESNDQVLIFASGVSNSRETRSSEFKRECGLLRSHLDFSGLLVYISTCSVNDASLSETAYIRHKLQMEKWVMSRTEDSLVFRLPIVVGRSKNKNTLINFLKNKIELSENFLLHKNACRHFIGYSDLKCLLPELIRDGSFVGRTVNVLTTERVSLPDVVSTMEELLEKRGTYSHVESGNCYELELSQDVKRQPRFKLKTLKTLLLEDYFLP